MTNGIKKSDCDISEQQQYWEIMCEHLEKILHDYPEVICKKILSMIPKSEINVYINNTDEKKHLTGAANFLIAMKKALKENEAIAYQSGLNQAVLIFKDMSHINLIPAFASNGIPCDNQNIIFDSFSH